MRSAGRRAAAPRVPEPEPLLAEGPRQL
jgi:hypothetical protein